MSQIMRNPIRSHLAAFAKQWQQASRENADAKLFWARFYECFGIRPGPKILDGSADATLPDVRARCVRRRAAA